MRTSFSGFLGIALFLFFLPFFVSAATFSRDLSLGDSGQDVLALQRLLNEDERTQIAAFGPGSPGNETAYFGSLTADAVRRYQEAHASEILTPLGLLAGTGFFGPATRENAEKELVLSSAGTSFDREAVSNAEVLTPEEITELNRENADDAIEVVKTSLEDAGLSSRTISKVEDEFRRQSEMTFEELEEELRESRSKFKQEARTPEEIVEDMEDRYGLSVPEGPMTTFAEALAQMILPKPTPAYAQSYLIPLGASVLSYYICGCSGLWYIILGPPRPGTVTYETGTQYYSGYNLPFTTYFVGYSVPINPTCWIPIGTGCGAIPSTYGVLTPMVGSSSF